MAPPSRRLAHVAQMALTSLLLLILLVQYQHYECRMVKPPKLLETPPAPPLDKSNSEAPPYVRPGTSSAELLRYRGFKAREYYFVTRDGYILCITRGLNPLINKGRRGLKSKYPILFLHGATLSPTSYLINSAGVKPKNFAHLNTRKLSLKRLFKRVGRDPSAKSLPFLAMNFGYEIWILDRRGYAKSRNKIGHLHRTASDALQALPYTLFGNFISGFSLLGGAIPGRPNKKSARLSRRRVGLDTPAAKLAPSSARMGGLLGHLIKMNFAKPVPDEETAARRLLQLVKRMNKFLPNMETDETLLREAIRTFDPSYWDFSLDEQIEYDLPAAIDFILGKTGQPKVHMVSLSCGGSIALMGLANKPELSKKVGRSILWAPAVTLGSESDIVYLLGFLSPFLQGFAGPLPPTFAVRTLETVMQKLCSDEKVGKKNLCERIFDQTFGFSGRQAPMSAATWAVTIQAASVNELLHLGQLARTRRPCKFNFNTPQKNVERYNSREVPCYDLSTVQLQNMSFYVGKYDRLASWADVNHTISQLSVPSQVTVIKEQGVYFNHIGYLIHAQTARLAIVPSLFDIEMTENARTDINRTRTAANRPGKKGRKQRRLKAKVRRKDDQVELVRAKLHRARERKNKADASHRSKRSSARRYGDDPRTAFVSTSLESS